MNLQDQVTSLELSKKLKELGVKQESLFWWKKYDGNFIVNDIPRDGDDECYSAFSTSELGEIILRLNWHEIYVPYTEEWHEIIKQLDIFAQSPGRNEANDRAEVIIYLLENKLITL